MQVSPFCAQTEVITGSQTYKPGDGIIGVPTSGSIYSYTDVKSDNETNGGGYKGFEFSDSTSGSLYTRIYKNIVQNGSSRYNLKMTAANSEWFTKKLKYGQKFILYNLNAAQLSYTWYVTDASGNPIDWTGYVNFWEIDKTESVHIPASAVLEETYIGTDIKARESSSVWSGCTVYRGNKDVDDGDGKAYNNRGVVLKIKIPASGLKVNFCGYSVNNGDGAHIRMPFLSEYVSKCSISTSSSGKWE